MKYLRPTRHRPLFPSKKISSSRNFKRKKLKIFGRYFSVGSLLWLISDVWPILRREPRLHVLVEWNYQWWQIMDDSFRNKSIDKNWNFYFDFWTEKSQDFWHFVTKSYLNQLTNFSHHRNFVNKVISGSLVKISSFSEK